MRSNPAMVAANSWEILPYSYPGGRGGEAHFPGKLLGVVAQGGERLIGDFDVQGRQGINLCAVGRCRWVAAECAGLTTRLNRRQDRGRRSIDEIIYRPVKNLS